MGIAWDLLWNLVERLATWWDAFSGFNDTRKGAKKIDIDFVILGVVHNNIVVTFRVLFLIFGKKKRYDTVKNYWELIPEININNTRVCA